jgi:hypothetical protein
MKRPLFALGISVLVIIAGSAVCVPGICGCVSWLGIPDSKYSNHFMWLYLSGILGVLSSIVWLIITAARMGSRRSPR